ncbi:MAG: alpha/beta hydrolase [Gemmatimonadaceae bacterium]
MSRRHCVSAILPALLLSAACAPVTTIVGAGNGGGRVVPERVPRGLFTETRFGVQVANGVAYGSAPVRQPNAGSMTLRLDLYEPTGAGLPSSRPGIVLVHGGGFNTGGRNNRVTSGLCRELTARGYVCASIDYRLEGNDPPTTGATPRERAALAAMEDAGMALEWLRRNASRYSVDPSRVAIGGGSAGAAAAMLLTYTGLVPVPPAAVVVDLWGSMDAYVDTMRSGAPPIIIIHGMFDPTVSIANARAIVARARAVGIPFAFLPLQSQGHPQDLSAAVQGESLYQHVVNFLFTYLRLGELGS